MTINKIRVFEPVKTGASIQHIGACARNSSRGIHKEQTIEEKDDGK